MRNVLFIAQTLHDTIPDDCDIKFDGFKRLIYRDVITSIPYSPQEKLLSNYYWNILGNLANKYITIDDYNNIDWCKKYIDIFQDPNYSEST